MEGVAGMRSIYHMSCLGEVLGDIAKGNGDRTLTQFGAKVTPNQHALANQFGLYDNTWCTSEPSRPHHDHQQPRHHHPPTPSKPPARSLSSAADLAT